MHEVCVREGVVYVELVKNLQCLTFRTRPTSSETGSLSESGVLQQARQAD